MFILEKLKKLKKTQSTTEYIIVLAVIIVIGLIIAAIMGWFPGQSTEITKNQSKAYWKSTDTFYIEDWQVYSDGEIKLIINNISQNPIKIKQIYVDGNYYDVDLIIYSGKKEITINTGKQYKDTVSLKLGVVYDTPFIKNKKFIGRKPLIADVLNNNSNNNNNSTYDKTISFSADETLTNYTAKINLQANAETGPDFYNISFYDESGNELPYWIENYNYNQDANIYVKVPEIPGKIYLKYIHRDQNTEALFEFFDDFNNLDNWSIHDATTYDQTYIDNGYLIIGDDSVELNRIFNNLENNYEIVLKLKNQDIGEDSQTYDGTISIVSSKYPSPTAAYSRAVIQWLVYPYRPSHVASGAETSYDCADSLYYDANTLNFHIFTLRISPTGVKYILDDNVIFDVGCGWDKPIQYVYLGATDGGGNITDMNIDWLYIRKYNNPEPIYVIE